MEKNIVELRTLRKTNRAYMNYVYFLRQRGEIGAYVSEDGYAAFCPEEIEEYKRRVHRGRPMTKRRAVREYDDTRVLLENIMADISRAKKGE